MTFLGHVLVIVCVAGAVMLLGVAVAFLLARRFLRRHWHRARSHPAARGALTAVSLLAAWRERAVSRRTPSELSQGSAARARRHMWRAIDDADAAVQHADAVNAPVAELPAVCGALRHAGGELDSLLRLERRLPESGGRPDAVRMQVADVIAAARDVQLAALQASGDAHEPVLRSAVRDARDEVEIVAAAITRLRSVTPQRP